MSKAKPTFKDLKDAITTLVNGLTRAVPAARNKFFRHLEQSGDCHDMLHGMRDAYEDSLDGTEFSTEVEIEIVDPVRPTTRKMHSKVSVHTTDVSLAKGKRGKASPWPDGTDIRTMLGVGGPPPVKPKKRKWPLAMRKRVAFAMDALVPVVPGTKRKASVTDVCLDQPKRKTVKR